MADTFLTLLDMTKTNGTDQAVGIVEEVRTFAPEVNVISGRPIKGTTYKALVRSALPGGLTQLLPTSQVAPSYVLSVVSLSYAARF